MAFIWEGFYYPDNRGGTMENLVRGDRGFSKTDYSLAW